jgi:AraC-like DNA-binding protein
MTFDAVIPDDIDSIGHASGSTRSIESLQAIVRAQLPQARCSDIEIIAAGRFRIYWASACHAWTADEKQLDNGVFERACRVCGSDHGTPLIARTGLIHMFSCPPSVDHHGSALIIEGNLVAILMIDLPHGASKPSRAVAEAMLRFIALSLVAAAGAAPRELPAPPVHGSGPASRRTRVVDRVLTYIENRYAGPLTLAECAREAGLNSAYFCSVFKEIVGVSFKSYLTALRLRKAKTLLSDPTVRVADAARAVGYADPNHFRHVFKIANGVSPSVWRERF